MDENYASRNKENQWHTDLNYLRELLYQTLQASKNKLSTKEYLYSRIRVIENLANKKLYKLALIEIKDCIKLAEKDRLLPILLILNEYKSFCDFFIHGLNSKETRNTLARMMKDANELSIDKQLLYLVFQFGKSKQLIEKDPSDKNVSELKDSFNEWKKLISSILENCR